MLYPSVFCSQGSVENEMNAVMRDKNEIIWKQGWFRFKHTGTNLQSLTYKYNGFQDMAHTHSHQSTAEKQQDGRRMARFLWQSRLNLWLCLQDRSLSLSIHHKWHAPYEDIQISPLIQKLIHLRVSNKTPSEIYREIMTYLREDLWQDIRSTTFGKKQMLGFGSGILIL